MKTLGAILGVVVGIVGVVLLTGLVPLSAVGNTTCGTNYCVTFSTPGPSYPPGQSGVNVSFQINVSGYTATLYDKSTASSGYVFGAGSVEWGDGTYVLGASMKIGGTYSHAYGTNGNYTVTETIEVTADNFNTFVAGTASATIAAKQASSSNGNTPNCAPNCPSVQPNFKFVATNLSVNFTDQSTFTASSLNGLPTWNFGDTQQGTGISVSHTYAAAGNYTVTETVAAKPTAGGNAFSQSISFLVTVHGGKSNKLSTGPPPPPPSSASPTPFKSPIPATPLGLGLAFGGFGFAGLSLVQIGGPWIRYVGGVVLFFLGLGLGYGVIFGI